MSISIQTNVTSLVAQNNLSVNNMFQQNTITQLTSGYRINKSGDDAAGLVIANTYRNNLAELNQGIQNANNGVAELQIMDGGLNNISNILDRLKTLATEASSGTLPSGTGPTSINNEFNSLLAEIDRQAANIGLSAATGATAADGQYITTMSVWIGGAAEATNAQVNVDLTGGAVDSASLGVTGEDLTTTAGAQTALADVNTAVQNLGAVQGTVGAGENDLQYAIALAQSQVTNFSAAQSAIRDTDVAAQAANLTKAQVLQQASMAAMAQANSSSSAVLKLFQ
ncbi:MAG: flagellin [Bryobacteraceae bacterium]